MYLYLSQCIRYFLADLKANGMCLLFVRSIYGTIQMCFGSLIDKKLHSGKLFLTWVNTN